jgi:hypothetical protein
MDDGDDNRLRRLFILDPNTFRFCIYLVEPCVFSERIVLGPTKIVSLKRHTVGYRARTGSAVAEPMTVCGSAAPHSGLSSGAFIARIDDRLERNSSLIWPSKTWKVRKKV